MCMSIYRNLNYSKKTIPNFSHKSSINAQCNNTDEPFNESSGSGVKHKYMEPQFNISSMRS